MSDSEVVETIYGKYSKFKIVKKSSVFGSPESAGYGRTGAGAQSPRGGSHGAVDGARAADLRNLAGSGILPTHGSGNRRILDAGDFVSGLFGGAHR